MRREPLREAGLAGADRSFDHEMAEPVHESKLTFRKQAQRKNH
jgi:hypothetical protein